VALIVAHYNRRGDHDGIEVFDRQAGRHLLAADDGD
jgi:hypothetical protein